jgi:hypothetical protein
MEKIMFEIKVPPGSGKNIFINKRLKELYGMRGTLEAKENEVLLVPANDLMLMIDELISYVEILQEIR